MNDSNCSVLDKKRFEVLKNHAEKDRESFHEVGAVCYLVKLP